MPAIIKRLATLLGFAAPTPRPETKQSVEDLIVQREFKAIDDLRALAKWLLTIFAAVAALLTAGVQVSSISHLAILNPRLWLAVGCGMLAVSAVAVILWQFVLVLTPVSISIKMLATEEGRNPTSPDIQYLVENGYLGDHASVKALYDASRRPNAPPTVSLRVQRVNATVLFHRTRRQFRRAFTIALPAAVLTALFIAGFAWSANPPAPTAGPFQVPADADVKLDQTAQLILTERLGPSCVTSNVHVVVLSGDNGKFDVVSVPSSRCKVARFTVGGGPLGVNGTLVQRSAVSLARSPIP